MRDVKSIPMDQRRSHFRNLAALAGKDAHIADAEKGVLAYVAAKWGLSDHDIAESNANPNAIEVTIPGTRELCFQQLYDLVEMMIIDEVMKRDEKALCQAMAGKLGFAPEAVDRIAHGIADGNRQGVDEDVIQTRLRKALGVAS